MPFVAPPRRVVTGLAVSMALCAATAAGLTGKTGHSARNYTGDSHLTPADEDRCVREFEHASRLAIAREYSVPNERRRQGAAWVFVVHNDLDTETRVHFVRWYPPPADVPPAQVHRIVTVNGWAMPRLALLDVNGDGREEVIIRVSGVSYSRIVIVDFNRPQGREILLDDMEAPASWRSDFADLDRDGKCEIIRWVKGSKLSDRTDDGRKWAAFKDAKTAYMIYHLREGKYRFFRVTTSYPIVGQPAASL